MKGTKLLGAVLALSVALGGCTHLQTLPAGEALTPEQRGQRSVSLDGWVRVPVWKDGARCEARLKGSFTGSLRNPMIGEAGRAFLAGLLVQLTDAQLRDLFESARVKRRSSDPSSDPAKDGPLASVDEWVELSSTNGRRSSTSAAHGKGGIHDERSGCVDRS